MYNLLQEFMDFRDLWTVDYYREVTVYHLNSLHWVLTEEVRLTSCHHYMSNYRTIYSTLPIAARKHRHSLKAKEVFPSPSLPEGIA